MRDRLSGGIDNARMKADLLDASLKRMAVTIGGAFTIGKAIEFGKVMMDVRGQIESFQISFETLIGSKDKANAFFSEIKDFATETPLMLDDLAKNAQTMLGFGIETEKVIPILKQIGDVTMGNKDRFNAMSLAFSQMYATGKLMGQDLLQMINAGFNPLIAISEKTGKSVKQLKDEMSEGAISAEMVAQAFADVTAEGGKFHGMLQKQSEGFNGMKAQFQGAVQDMFNSMGEASQGIVTQGLQVSTSLVKNYETVGKVLVGLIATYGAYKAAVMLAIEVERGYTIAQALHLRGMIALERAQKIMNATMLANPYVAITVAVIALGMALWALHDSTTAEEKAQKKLNDTLEEAKQKKENIKSKTSELISIIKDETQTIYAQIKAWKELQAAIPEAFKGMDIEAFKKLSPDEYKKMVNEAVDKREIKDIENDYNEQIKVIEAIKEKLTKKENGPGSRTLLGKRNISELKAELKAEEGVLQVFKNKIDEIREIEENEKNKINIFSDINTEIKNTSENVSELKKKLKELRDGNTQSINYSEDIEKTAKDLDKAEKKLALLTGKSNKKGTDSGLTTQEKANILKAEQTARKRQINEYTSSLVAQQKQSEFDITQAGIDGMKEGFEKEKAAIDLHFRKLLEENRLRKEKWIKDSQANENLKYENENPDWKKKGLSGPAVVTEDNLTSEQKKQIADYEDYIAGYKEQAEKKMLENSLKQYETFAQRYFEIQKKYQADIDELRKSGASEESIALAEQAQKDAMTALDEEFAQKEQTFQDLMSRIGYMTLQQLERTLKDAENALKKSDIDNGQDSKQSATQRAKIKKLQEEIKAVKTENEIQNSDELAKWKKTEKAIRDCKAEIDGMLDSMDFLDEETKSALQAASNVANGAIAMINGIKMLGIGAAASLSAVEKASVILAIIGAAVQIISAIFNMASAAEARHQEALKEIAREKTAFQREYNLLLIEQNELLKQAETIFGVDGYGKALGSIKQMKDAIAELNKQIKGEAPDKSKYFFNSFGYQKDLKAYQDGLKGLADIEVKTGHKKTGLFGWGKGKDIYSSVLEVFPKLIDESGKFDASIAKIILDTQTLSDEDKATLEYMINLSEIAEQAFQAMTDYLTDIFGELGNTMSDALVDAFRNGTDAAEKFTESVTGMLEDLAEQMIYSVMITPLIQKAQADMLDVMQNENMSREEQFNSYVGILDAMTDGILNQQGSYNAMMEEYKRIAAEKGLNLWESDSKKQSGKAGAYESASQDSITRLEGLYSSMLEHEISIDGGVENIVEGMNAALGHLKKIEENTGSSDEHLDKIEKAIETMKDDISTIKRDGIRTR